VRENVKNKVMLEKGSQFFSEIYFHKILKIINLFMVCLMKLTVFQHCEIIVNNEPERMWFN
jgi:hypothetical protein